MAANLAKAPAAWLAGAGTGCLQVSAHLWQPDLTASDVDTMQQVMDQIRAERGEDLEPTAGDDAWRHRLMGIGHDPLRPPNR